MSITFPGESPQYRAARDRLLEQEIEQRRAMEAVAHARRRLPPGGVVPQDYVFQGAGPDGAPTEASFEDGVPALPMDPQKIIDAVRQWNPFRAVTIHTIAIDPRIESATVGAKFIRLMKDLAAENRGSYTAIGGK